MHYAMLFIRQPEWEADTIRTEKWLTTDGKMPGVSMKGHPNLQHGLEVNKCHGQKNILLPLLQLSVKTVSRSYELLLIGLCWCPIYLELNNFSLHCRDFLVRCWLCFATSLNFCRVLCRHFSPHTGNPHLSLKSPSTFKSPWTFGLLAKFRINIFI